MMNILVTGASGFVGQTLCDTLMQSNFNVTAMVRNDTTTPIHCTQLINMTRLNDDDWVTILNGIDIIVHLAGRAHIMHEEADNPYQAYIKANAILTQQLAEKAARAKVKKFILMSSIKVNGETTAQHKFTADDTPNPQDDYAQSKLKAEEYLQNTCHQTNTDYVIIRPPLIYGKGVKANFKRLMKLSQSKLPIPLGAIHNQRSLIYLENLIDFLQACIKCPQANNQTFVVSDNDDVSTTQLIQQLGLASNNKPCLLPIPQSWLRLCFTLIGKSSFTDRLCANLQIDSTKACSRLNWQPPFSFNQGIAKTVGEHS